MFVWDWEAMLESVVFQFFYEVFCPVGVVMML